MKKLMVVACLVVGLMIPASASAKKMNGMTGIGGEAMGNGVSSLSFQHWLGAFGIQGMLGFSLFAPEAEGADTLVEFDIGLRGLFTIARAQETNFNGGVGINLGILSAAETNTAITIDLLLGVEHFFTDHFSVGGRVSLPVHINPELRPGTGAEGVAVGIGNLGWGGAFHFWF